MKIPRWFGCLRYVQLCRYHLLKYYDIICLKEYVYFKYLQEKLDELGLFKGDTVLIKGKKRKDTIAIALDKDECPSEKIYMSRVVRRNLRVKVADLVR